METIDSVEEYSIYEYIEPYSGILIFVGVLIVCGIIAAIILVGKPVFCKAGTHGTNGKSPWFGVCVECEAGTYSGDNSDKCKKCKAGTYSTTSGSSGCIECGAGTYSTTSGSSECASCPAGNYSGEGSTSCRPCVAGTYSLGNASECIECGAGGCSPCPTGTFSSDPGSTECTDCPAGTFSNTRGSTECAECPPGGYTNSVGSTECEKCEEGQIYDSLKGACECGPGTYAEDGYCEPGYTNLKCGTVGVTALGVSSVSECAEACRTKNDSLVNANLKALGRRVDGFTRTFYMDELPIDQTHYDAKPIFDVNGDYNVEDAKKLINDGSTLEGLDDLTEAMVQYRNEFDTITWDSKKNEEIVEFTQIINLLHAYLGKELPFDKERPATNVSWWFGRMTFLAEKIYRIVNNDDITERTQECDYITYDTANGTCKLHSLNVEHGWDADIARITLRGCTTVLNEADHICVRACGRNKDDNQSIEDLPDNTWTTEDCDAFTQSDISPNEAIVRDFKLGYLPDILNNNVHRYSTWPPGTPEQRGKTKGTVSTLTRCEKEDGIITKFVRV